MNMEPTQRTVEVHCNSCGQTTNHIVLHEEKREFAQQVTPEISVELRDWYRLITCAGCKVVSMEHVSANSEDWEPDTGPNYSKEYFPPRTFRREPDWVADDSIPPHIGRLLGEIYIALQNRANSLAGLGIRALLESVMIQQVGDNGTFAVNLKELMDEGHVSRGQFNLLESTLELGHAAMHRGYVPSDEAIVACIDAVENIIQSIYVFPRVSASLRKKVPKRRRTKRASKRRVST